MIKCLRGVIFVLTLVLTLASAGVRAENLTLLMHITPQAVTYLPVTPPQQQWLQKKQTLVVGILPFDSPPYDFHTLSEDYEGLSADYLGLIARKLRLQTKVVEYETSEQLWRALANGEIDVIPGVTNSRSNGRYLTSTPYNSEQPVLAVKASDQQPLPSDLADTPVAMVAGYIDPEKLKQVYPAIRLQVYDNYQQALSAVAFGDARVFLGNSYSITRNYLNNLRIERYANLPERQVSFALRRSSPLASLIDGALASIPQERAQELQRFWRAGLTSDIVEPLALTPAEQRWIKNHPVVKVLLYGSDNTAPVAFIDQTDAVRGIAADVLGLVRLKTGMKFSFSSVGTLNALVEEVNTSKADMIAALAPSSERQQTMLFTYPYTRSAFAIITATDNNSITRLTDLRGKKLALVKQAALGQSIAQRYPSIKILYFDNDQDLFNSVATGQTDAAIGLLISADYQVSNRFRDRLKIVNTVGDNTAYISFAVGKRDPELHSILNKVLLKIPPYELEMLANRWRPNNMVVVDSFWSRHRTALILTALAALALLLLALARTFWLRREVLSIAKAHKKLSGQFSLMETLVGTMPFPLSLRDRQCRLTYGNKIYVELCNEPFESLKGLTLLDSPGNLTLDQAQFFHQKMMAVIATNTPYINDHQINRKDRNGGDDTILTANIWLLPWHDTSGNVAGVLAGMWDVSEREKLVRQLSEASERAEASNRAKSTFLSTMSHEIRTPMNAIIGMLDMALKKGKQGEQDLQALEVAYESAEGLVGLIGDILDLSRVEGGQLEFRPVRINLATLINQLLVIFNGLALDKSIMLQKQFPEEAIADTTGDPLRIKQVLSNILSNAIKFTDQGGVTLRLWQEIDHAKGEVLFRIEVQDSGVGIAPEQQAALFRPFSQADNRRAGTGLGLYISRNLCETMGGKMSLSSLPGSGTCVQAEFTLALAPVLEIITAEEEELTAETGPLRVLVVDDNPANRILLAKQLAWLGHHAHVAADGFEGLELWQQETFDVIVTDCNMPGMNGYQFTQHIREAEKESGQAAILILGFTANAMQEIIERCLAAGMNGCLFKPYTIGTLAGELNKLKR